MLELQRLLNEVTHRQKVNQLFLEEIRCLKSSFKPKKKANVLWIKLIKCQDFLFSLFNVIVNKIFEGFGLLIWPMITFKRPDFFTILPLKIKKNKLR